MPKPLDPADHFPLGTVTMYGPTASRATKVVAAVVPGPDEPVSMLQRWFVASGDIRNSKEIMAEVSDFLRDAEVRHTSLADRIMGCPHEEGIDYPLGQVCPECPFWAETDRFTHQPKAPVAAPVEAQHISAPEVIAALSEYRGCPPRAALAAADFHREELTPVLLEALEYAVEHADDLSDEDSHLCCHSLYLMAKWREARALPFLLRMLALPEELAAEIAGEVLFEDGCVLLADISGGDHPDIRALIENREAEESLRAEALTGLELLAARGEMPRADFVAYIQELIDSKLEREPVSPWAIITMTVGDFGLVDLLPSLRKAYDEELVDEGFFPWEHTEEAARSTSGKHIEDFLKHHQPITDVAAATEMWPIYHDAAPERPPATAKVGRNDQCPCGSGKKYKKCCGA